MDHERSSSSTSLEDSESSGTLSVLARAEINQQIATAKQFPRSITDFAREAEQLVTLNAEMARACVYALPRGGKVIEGPSARFAEIMAYAFKNLRYGARPMAEDGEFITSQGVAYDLERNNGCQIEVKRRITDKNNVRFNADMIGVTANAANSIALRNALLKIVPKALWDPIYQKARKTIMGDFKTFNARLGEMFEEFQRYGVTKEMICVKLEKKGVADIKIEDMVVLGGMLTALQDGDSTPEQMFANEPGGGIQQPSERKPTEAEQKEIDARKAELAKQAEQAAEAKKNADAKDDKARKGKKKDVDPPAENAQQGDLVGGQPAQQQNAPADTSNAAQSTTTVQTINANMQKQVKLRLEAYDVNEAEMLKHFGVDAIDKIPMPKINDVLMYIEQKGTPA